MKSSSEFAAFLEGFGFVQIFKAFHIAVQPGKLLIGVLAIGIVCLTGWIMDLKPTVLVSLDKDKKIICTELDIYVQKPELFADYQSENQTSLIIDQRETTKTRRGVFSTLWNFTSERFHRTLGSMSEFDIHAIKTNTSDLLRAVAWTAKYHTIYGLILFLIAHAVISIAAGAICRISALQFAQGEKPGPIEAISFSLKKFPNLFFAPLLPVIIVIFAALLILLIGILANIPYAGELIVALLLTIVLLTGIFLTVMIIGAAAGLPLMYPAVGYDNADCFDAVARSYNYVCTKPWRFVFYWLITIIYGALCYTFVRFFAFLLLRTCHFFLSTIVWTKTAGEMNKMLAIWPKPTFLNLAAPPETITASATEHLAALIIHIQVLIVVGIVVSFVISFFFSAATIIYALLRYKVDETNFQQVHNHFKQKMFAD